MAIRAMDKSCVISALLFLVGNLASTIGTIIEIVPHSDLSKWKDLDAVYIKQIWQTDSHPLTAIGGLLVALAWFVFTIPITQLAWILSRGGKRNVPLHTMMVLLVIAGSFTELIARLLQMGMWGIMRWVAADFNMSNWSGGDDDIGWKVLELISTVVRGMTFWVDAFEWLAMFGIILAIVVSFHTASDSLYKDIPNIFPWLSILLVGYCAIEFTSDILRMLSWTTFQTVSLILSLFMTIVLFPIWLLTLGSWLPSATPTYDEKTDYFFTPYAPKESEGKPSDNIQADDTTDALLPIV